VTSAEPEFLDLSDVLDIHEAQIAAYGGMAGVRDTGLLESAIAQPQASFGGQYVHESVFEMAAAYVFHLAKNHPFLDGNKRTALNAALTFLGLNGVDFPSPTDELYVLTLAVAEGRLQKAAIAAELERISRG
jgi:death-on-curing protein